MASELPSTYEEFKALYFCPAKDSATPWAKRVEKKSSSQVVGRPYTSQDDWKMWRAAATRVQNHLHQQKQLHEKEYTARLRRQCELSKARYQAKLKAAQQIQRCYRRWRQFPNVRIHYTNIQSEYQKDGDNDLCDENVVSGENRFGLQWIQEIEQKQGPEDDGIVLEPKQNFLDLSDRGDNVEKNQDAEDKKSTFELLKRSKKMPQEYVALQLVKLANKYEGDVQLYTPPPHPLNVVEDRRLVFHTNEIAIPASSLVHAIKNPFPVTREDPVVSAYDLARPIPTPTIPHIDEISLHTAKGDSLEVEIREGRGMSIFKDPERYVGHHIFLAISLKYQGSVVTSWNTPRVPCSVSPDWQNALLCTALGDAHLKLDLSQWEVEAKLQSTTSINDDGYLGQVSLPLFLLEADFKSNYWLTRWLPIEKRAGGVNIGGEIKFAFRHITPNPQSYQLEEVAPLETDFISTPKKRPSRAKKRRDSTSGKATPRTSSPSKASQLSSPSLEESGGKVIESPLTPKRDFLKKTPYKVSFKKLNWSGVRPRTNSNLGSTVPRSRVSGETIEITKPLSLEDIPKSTQDLSSSTSIITSPVGPRDSLNSPFKLEYNTSVDPFEVDAVEATIVSLCGSKISQLVNIKNKKELAALFAKRKGINLPHYTKTSPMFRTQVSLSTYQKNVHLLDEKYAQMLTQWRYLHPTDSTSVSSYRS